MYFQFFILHDWRKRSAIQPQGIFPEFPQKQKSDRLVKRSVSYKTEKHEEKSSGYPCNR